MLRLIKIFILLFLKAIRALGGDIGSSTKLCMALSNLADNGVIPLENS